MIVGAWLSTGAEEEVKGKFCAVKYGTDRFYRVELYTFRTQYDGTTPNYAENSRWRLSMKLLNGITVGVEGLKRPRASTVTALRFQENY